MKQAAGTLLYRQTKEGLQVVLVHPSGNYNKKSPWSIPKGLPDEGEELEAAARRETREEAGIDVTGPLTYLGYIDYTKSKKRVHCYAGPAPDEEPHAASWEIDQARFMSIDEARERIHSDQRPFLDRLLEHLED
jgi:predicted NUDIX family NTP pyrophosphohydrolase